MVLNVPGDFFIIFYFSIKNQKVIKLAHFMPYYNYEKNTGGKK